MGLIRVVDYEAGRKSEWDDFVVRSKNGVFLFQRDYIEYHGDRLTDNSLLFYDESGQLLALLPATLSEGVLCSHAGLTFGGVVSDSDMKVALMLEVFEATRVYLQNHDMTKLIYKAVPHIYHRLPAEEDLYALFRNQARLIRRDVSSTLVMNERVSLAKGRKYALKLAFRNGLEVKRSFDFKAFMEIESQLLATKYEAKPVHTYVEMAMLAERFPENIKLFAAYRDQEMPGGVIIYESRQVAHTQYIAGSGEGKRLGALDLIINHLIDEYYADKKYLDFGVSTKNDGWSLNTGLIENKQSFGGRAVVYDFYEIDAHKNSK